MRELSRCSRRQEHDNNDKTRASRRAASGCIDEFGLSRSMRRLDFSAPVRPAFPASGLLLQPIHEHDGGTQLFELTSYSTHRASTVPMRWRMGDRTLPHGVTIGLVVQDRLAVSRFSRARRRVVTCMVVRQRNTARGAILCVCATPSLTAVRPPEVAGRGMYKYVRVAALLHSQVST